MKRCPTCDKTYEDNLRFCQIDGTSLVDVVEEIDPFKTMVASPEDIRAAMSSEPEPPKPEEPVLDLPEAPDPNRTQFVSEDELRAEMSRMQEDVVDIPPAVPEQDMSMTSPPIPSPFGSPKEVIEPAAPAYEEPKYEEPAVMAEAPASPFSEPSAPASPFAEPEPAREEASYNPFEHSAPVAKTEWTPPAAPEASWQNQDIGQNTPFQPPPAGVAGAGQNKTLAIVSLVVGILSILCCSWFLPGIAAVVMGFIARSKASSNPSEYGGAGLALGGIITGGISIVLGIIVVILYLFTGVLSGLANM